MKNTSMRIGISLGVALMVSFLPVHAWSWGSGGRGGFHGGFHGRSLHGGFGGHGFHGSPRGGCFPHGQRFGGSSFGGWGNGFSFQERKFFFSGPGGPPPLGAPGPTPRMFSGQPSVFRAPFFCVVHGREFERKAQFFEHLQQAHGIPPEQAWNSCSVVSSTQIGYFGQ